MYHAACIDMRQRSLGSQRAVYFRQRRRSIMVQIATLRRRSWASLTWLFVIGASLLAALALGNTIVLLCALTTALCSGWLLLRGQSPALTFVSPMPAGAVGVPRAQRGVWTADGTQRQA